MHMQARHKPKLIIIIFQSLIELQKEFVINMCTKDGNQALIEIKNLAIPFPLSASLIDLTPYQCSY